MTAWSPAARQRVREQRQSPAARERIRQQRRSAKLTVLDREIEHLGCLLIELRDDLITTETRYDELVRERNRLEREAA